MASVLVVEDVALVRQSVRAVLEEVGHTVKEAANGEEGLRILKDEPVDLVVADIWMPKLDGIAMLKVVKSLETAPPVIIISGGGPKASLELSATLAETWGADAILYKPFEDRELTDAVDRLLAERSRPSPPAA